MNELNIAHAIASDNLDVMRAVLYRCPVDWRAYADRLQACAEAAEATEPTAPADPVRLQAPGFTDCALTECGITMPKATHCSADGEPLVSLDALGTGANDLAEITTEMEDAGLNVQQVAAVRLQ